MSKGVFAIRYASGTAGIRYKSFVSLKLLLVQVSKKAASQNTTTRMNIPKEKVAAEVLAEPVEVEDAAVEATLPAR